jgi:hypothetical protein
MGPDAHNKGRPPAHCEPGEGCQQLESVNPKGAAAQAADPCDDSADDGRLYTSHDARSESPERVTVCLDVSYRYSVPNFSVLRLG